MSDPFAVRDLYICRLGPMLFDRGPTAMYIAFADGEFLDARALQPIDDDRGLRELSALVPEAESRGCSSELANVGKRYGLEPRRMTPEIAEHRAAFAMLAAWRTGETLGPNPALALAGAIRPFHEAAPWKTTPEHVRRRGIYELITDTGRDLAECTIQILGAERGDGPES